MPFILTLTHIRMKGQIVRIYLAESSEPHTENTDPTIQSNNVTRNATYLLSPYDHLRQMEVPI